MEEVAWRLRGKLSRRRAPSGGGSGESKLWAALLRAVHSDTALDGLSLPPLPTFTRQQTGPELLETPEVFTVGTKTFTWTPLLPAHGDPSHANTSLRGPTGPQGRSGPSLEGQHVPDPCGTPSPQEQLTKEGSLAMQSCPMCQREFSAEMTPLDVDGHLAQCLAESTEDVEW